MSPSSQLALRVSRGLLIPCHEGDHRNCPKKLPGQGKLDLRLCNCYCHTANRIVGLDLGLARSAYALIEPHPQRQTKQVQARLCAHRTIETTDIDSTDERMEILAVEFGALVWDCGGAFAARYLAIEDPPQGSVSAAFRNKATPQLQEIAGIARAAAIYGKMRYGFMGARSWHARIGVLPPPKNVKGPERKDWFKTQVRARVEELLEGAERLANEHERDAAGVALGHVIW